MCKQEKTIRLQIPNGFTVIRRDDRYDLERAVDILKGRRRKKYNVAIKNGTTAILRRDLLRCPHCGYEHSANVRALYPDSPFNRRFYRVSAKQIDYWGTLQIGFNDEQERELMLNEVFLPTYLDCRSCGMGAYEATGHYDVTITRKGHLIRVAVGLNELEDLISCRWLPNRSLGMGVDLVESVTFNFNNGHTYLQLCSADGVCVAARDITNEPDQWMGSPTFRLINAYRLVRRKVLGAFRAQWKGELPLQGNALQTEKLVELTRFMGYPREFYDGIPYRRGVQQLDKSFTVAARRIQSPAKAEQWLRRSRLPYTKSLCRSFYESPALFFYLPETEALWRVMGDLNVLVRFLRQRDAYRILLAIHSRPGLLEFLRDLCRVKGAVFLLYRLKKEWPRLRRYGLEYAAMTPSEKLREQERWKTYVCLDADEADRITLPVTPVPEGMEDCAIKGYQFRWLRTNDDYFRAGRHMDNCLVNWSFGDPPVVCVTWNDEYIAAIQVENGCVTQMMGPGNDSVEEDTPFDDAFDCWKKRFGISYHPLLNDDPDFAWELEELFR